MTTSTSSATSQHWAIVGGGMMGLTLAHRLTQRGQRVTVLESAPEIGGLASAWQLGDIEWDRHYHVTLLSDLHLRKLLGEFDLEHEMCWVETKTGFFADDKLYSMSNSWEFLRFPPLGLIEKFRLGLTIFAASKIKKWRPLEQVLVADWLRKWSGEGTFRKIWLPLLQAKLGETYRQVSAVFIWATISRMYRARQSGLKKEMFGYVPGGYARVLARMAEVLRAAGVDVQTSRPVTEIIGEDNGSVRVALDGRDDQVFDRVVLTAPSPVVARLCPQLGKEQRNRHEQIRYLGILCASVLLKKPLADYYVTNITESWVPFTAVIEMTTLVDLAELGGHHLVYLPRYVAADDPAWQWSDDQLQEKFVTALERMYPEFCRDDVEAFRISRVKRVMALPTLGYSDRLPAIATGIPNVFAVNSAQIVKGTLNVNEVVEVAENAINGCLLPPTAEPQSATQQSKPTQPSNGQTTRELVARP